MIFSDNKKPPE